MGSRRVAECRHIKGDWFGEVLGDEEVDFSLRKPAAFIALALACNQSHPSSAITSILSQ